MTTHEEYEFYKSKKICPDCRRENAAPGRVHCMNRLDRRKISNYKYRENLPPQVWKRFCENSAKKHNELRTYRKQNGLCIECGKLARKGQTRCNECALKHNSENRRRSEQKRISKPKKLSNVCRMCNNVVYKNFKVCKQHYDHLNNIRKLSSGGEVINKSIREMYKKNHCNKEANKPKINSSYKQIGV